MISGIYTKHKITILTYRVSFCSFSHIFDIIYKFTFCTIYIFCIHPFIYLRTPLRTSDEHLCEQLYENLLRRSFRTPLRTPCGAPVPALRRVSVKVFVTVFARCSYIQNINIRLYDKFYRSKQNIQNDKVYKNTNIAKYELCYLYK